MKYHEMVGSIAGQWWLEEDGKDGYYCPEEQELESQLEDGWSEVYDFWADMEKELLIFDRWEIKQQEKYTDGLGNKTYDNSTSWAIERWRDDLGVNNPSAKKFAIRWAKAKIDPNLFVKVTIVG